MHAAPLAQGFGLQSSMFTLQLNPFQPGSHLQMNPPPLTSTQTPLPLQLLESQSMISANEMISNNIKLILQLHLYRVIQ
mgnify:FL=1